MTHSVVIPLFNKAEYIAKTLESLMMQTKQPDELIIVDDASTDGSLEIAKGYLEQHAVFLKNCRIEIIELPENKGPGNARNTGFLQTSGELISFLDADDIYHPHLLLTADYKFRTEKLDFLVLNMEFIPDGEVLPDVSALKKYLHPIAEGLYSVKTPLKAVSSPHFIMGVGSNVITKSKWVKSVQYTVDSLLYEGIDFWYRVLKNILADSPGNIALLTGNYLKVRRVKGSLSRKAYTNFKEIGLPPVVSRYKNSTDINDRLLMGMVGKRWYVHSVRNLVSAKQKALFIFNYGYLLPKYVDYCITRLLN